MNIPLQFGQMFYVFWHRTASALDNIGNTGKERREKINSSAWTSDKYILWKTANQTNQLVCWSFVLWWFFFKQEIKTLLIKTYYLRNKGLSSSVKKVTAFPLCPALPVRPATFCRAEILLQTSPFIPPHSPSLLMHVHRPRIYQAANPQTLLPVNESTAMSDTSK